MTSLLLPLESYQTQLRECRRSSFNSINAVPRIFSNIRCTHEDESALADEGDQVKPFPPASAPPLSTLPQVQLPDRAPKIMIPRHFNLLTVTDTDIPSPPSDLSPSSIESPKSLLPDSGENDPEVFDKERINWRLASGFFAYFLCGWGDGVTGTVLPHIMATFNVSFALSSLLYAGSTIGFCAGTVAVDFVMNYLGRFDTSNKTWSWIPEFGLPNMFSRACPKKQVGNSPSQARLVVVLSSSVVLAMFFVTMGSKSGYWVCFVAYALAAFARAFLTASLNEYFATGYEQSLGYAFGMWSFGGVTAPLVCQAVLARGVPWNKFYLGSLVLSGCNTAFLTITFRPTTREFLRDCKIAVSNNEKLSSRTSSPILATKEFSPIAKEPRKRNALSLALSLPYQWAIFLLAFIYCGCETTPQAFMASYLLNVRHANPKTAGFVTSGFWAGITIGRLTWGHYTPRLTYTQRKWVIESCFLAMHIIIWTVRSTVLNALAASLVGLLLGPTYPAILSLANKILPPDITMVSMGLSSAAASLGVEYTATFPFVTGLISTAYGVQTLPYMTVPLTCATALIWAMFPSKISSRQA